MNPFEVFYNNEQVWKTVDHRVNGWLFMSSMLPTWILVILALVGVIYGPRYMKSRQPLNIGPFMAFYNILIIIFNLYIACQLVIGGYRKQYDWFCEKMDSSITDHEEMRIVRAMHLFYICKMMEMFDTFFLIARKKSMVQNTTLVIHHAIVAWGSWVAARWMPSGCVFAPATLMATVHAIMYTYFTLVVFLPSFIKSSFIKYAFYCFLVLQLLAFLAYSLIIVWIQCTFLLPMAYIALVFLSALIINNIIKILVDYRRAPKGNGIMNFVFQIAKEEAEALKYADDKRKHA